MAISTDGRTGQARWHWRTPIAGDFNNSHNDAVQSRVTPLVVRLGDGRRAVCIWTDHYRAGSAIVLLDADGQEMQRRLLRFRLNGDSWQRESPDVRTPPYYAGLFQVWAQDLDGDGSDELLFFTHDRLCATRNGLEQTLWEWPLPHADCDLLAILPATPERAVTLAVKAGERVVGLAGPSGQPCWACAGPGTPGGVLAAAAGDAGPRILVDLGDEVAVCRRTLPMNPAGVYQVATGFQPFAAAAVADPRLVRRLPWQPITQVPFLPAAQPLLPASPLTLEVILLAVATAVVVVPALLVRSAVRRRSLVRGLLLLPWLAAVGAVVYAAVLLQLDLEAGWQISQRGEAHFAGHIGWSLVVLAAAGLPAVAFVLGVGRLLRERAWGKLAVLLLAALALAAGIAIAWAGAVAPDPTIEPNGSARGWYTAWPLGVYAAGIILLILWLLRQALRLGRRGFIWLRRDRRARSLPAEAVT
jgi:hypothetical protein